jgi:hypothetical protein
MRQRSKKSFGFLLRRRNRLFGICRETSKSHDGERGTQTPRRRIVILNADVLFPNEGAGSGKVVNQNVNGVIVDKIFQAILIDILRFKLVVAR